MKVLHVIDSAGVWGAENMLLELTTRQRALGVDASILSMGKPSDGIKSIEKEMDWRGIPYSTFRSAVIPTPCVLRRLLQQVLAKKPTLIHSHGYKGNVLLGGGLRRWIAVPLIATLHGWVAKPNALTKRRLYEELDMFAIRRFDAVVLVSGAMRAHRRFRSTTASGDPSVSVIDNGISEQVPEMSQSVPTHVRDFLRDGTVVGSIGRLSREKGFSYLVDAFYGVSRKFPKAKLLLIGDGPVRRDLQRRIDGLNLGDRAMITGYVNEAAALTSRLSLYVCSSLSEGLPLTVLEAMRARTPIVSTAVGSIPEILGDGAGGKLVPPESVDALEGAITKLLSNPGLASSMAVWSHESFVTKYSSKIMCDRYLQVYKDALQARKLSSCVSS